MCARWAALAACTGLPGSGVSSRTLMNEQPSKSSRRNQSSKTSKIASRRSTGSGGADLDLGLEPVAGPALLAAGEEREDELVLRGEVPVERHLRDARRGDDRVHAHRADAVAGKELVCRLEDPRRAGGPTVATDRSPA